MGFLEFKKFLKEKKDKILLLAILLLGAFLRFNQNIFEAGYHFDELAIVAVAKQSFPFGILKAAAKFDYHAPLYYFISHFAPYFSPEWLYLRLLNFIFSILNIYVFYKIGSLLKNKSLGLILALILAINHFFVGISYFIKFYCLDFLLFSISIYYFIKILKNKECFYKLAFSNSLFILGSTLGFVFSFFQYLTIFLFLKKDKISKKKLIKSLIFPICSFLAYFPILVSQTITSSQNVLSPHIHHLKIGVLTFYIMINDYFCPLIHDYSLLPTVSAMDILSEIIKNPNFLQIFSFLFFSFFPVLICTVLIFQALKKEKLNRIIFLPSALFTLFFMVLAKLEVTGYMSFYVFPFGIILLVLMGFGIFLIKNKKIKIIVLIYYVLINILITYCYPFQKRAWIYLKHYICPIEYIQNKEKANEKNTYILTYAGRFFKLYFKNSNIISFDEEASGGFFKKDMLEKFYGKEFTKDLSKENFFPKIKKYVLENQKNPEFEKFIKEEYLNKINKKEKLVFVFMSESLPFCPNKKDIEELLKEDNIYFHLYDPKYAFLQDEKEKIKDADDLSDLSSSLINESLIEIIEKNNFKRTKIERYNLKQNGEIEKTSYKTEELPSTIWLMENLLYGWTFVTYQKE